MEISGCWKVGTKIVKLKGYPFPGEIRAAFTTKAGLIRYVVESELAPGMLHIFSHSQIMPIAN